MRARPRLATLLCVAFLFALPFVLFAPVTLGDKTLLPADILYQYEPFKSDAPALGVGTPQNGLLADLALENLVWKKFALDSLRGGELPLWNPYLFAGVPFLAAGQHSLLYPPSLLYFLLPLEKAYGWYTVINLAIAGLCMFVLMRTLRVRRGAALFAAVAYEFSGFMVASVVFQMIIGAAAWLPLILAMCERVIRQWPGLRGRPATAPWAVIGALALGMHVLAGHIEIVVYTGLVTALYCAWRLVDELVGRRRAAGDQERRGAGRWLASRLAWLAGMAALGMGLGAIQLVPLVELVTRNFRSGRTAFEQVLSYGFPPREALNWLMPNFFGNPAHHTYFDLFTGTTQAVTTASGHTHWGVKNYVEGGAYVGLLTLILTAVAVARWIGGLFKGRGAASKTDAARPVGFFVVLSLFSLAFIFGTPLYAILYYGLPGINQLHSPFRWIFPLTLCLAALSGIGLHELLEPGRGRAWRRALSAAAVVGIALGGALLLGLAAARAAWPTVEPVIARALAGLLNADKAFTSAQMFFSYEARNIALFALLLIAACALVLLAARRPTSAVGRYAPILAVILLAIDLSVAWYGFNPAIDPKLLSAVPEAARFLQADKTPWRMTSYTPAGERPFHANIPWLLGMQDVRGYDSIIPKQYVDYMQLIEPQNELLYNRVAPLSNAASLGSPLLDLLGVKYVATEQALEAPGFTKVWDGGRLKLYRNERALPRAFTLPQDSALLTSDFGQSVQSNNPTQYVMIDASCGITDTGCVIPRPGKAVPATVTSYRNNEVWIDAQVSEPSWLVLTDSYFPGWRAFVRPLGAPDGAEREVQIGLVNGNFRAVRLDGPKTLAATGTANEAPLRPTGPSLGPTAPGVAAAAPVAYTVRFRYSPDSVRLGVLISMLAVASLIFIASVYVWRTLATAAGESTGVRRVARNSLMLTAVNIGARLIDFAFATLMLRVLGPEGAGNYAFAVVIVSWFEIFMNFGLNTYLTREVARDHTHAEAYLFNTSSLRMLLGAMALPAVVAVAFLSGGGEVGWAIFLLTLSQVPSSLSTGISALFFAYERAEVPAAITLVTALLKVVFGTLFLLGGLGIVGLALASIIVNVITLAVLAIAARRVLGVRYNRATFTARPATESRSDMMRESFPLMLNHLLATLFFKIDVPLLQAMKGPTVVGWYSTAYKFVDAFNIIPAFFTQSLFPTMSRMAASRSAGGAADAAGGDPLARSYVLALKLLVMVALPTAVATTYLAEWMVGVLGGREFLPQGQIALMIMVWSIPVGWINSVTNYALIAVGQQRALTRAFIIGLTFNIAANLVMIPLFSFAGAALVTILSEIVEGTAFYWYVRRHIIRVRWVDVLAKPALASGVMALVAFPFAAAGWQAVGIAAGGLAYLGVLAILRALSAGEREMLAPLLPGRVRRLMLPAA